MPGQSPPGWPHESSPPSPGGSSCQCNRRASRPSAGTALSRAGSVACHAAGALLVAFAALLALPLQAQAQSTLVSNLGQGNDSSADFNPPVAQRFTTGSNPGGYTLSRVEIKPEDSDSFSVSVCGVDASSFPGSTCTALTAPGSFAPGALVFNAPAGTTVSASTTYTVVATPGSNDVTFEATTADCEDTGGAAGWALANAYDWRASSNARVTTTTNKSLRVAIKGPTVQVPAAVSDVVVVPVPRSANSLQVSWSAPDDAGRNHVMEDSKKACQQALAVNLT